MISDEAELRKKLSLGLFYKYDPPIYEFHPINLTTSKNAGILTQVMSLKELGTWSLGLTLRELQILDWVC